MSSTPKQQAIDEQLMQLRDSSAATHGDIEKALLAIRPHGDDVALAWLLACSVHSSTVSETRSASPLPRTKVLPASRS